ncbi:MAG: hypothetical protein H0V44_08065 [Planctomycetes bacterium]|nr:hypothetical protein [Planctomycetota bacterium]
MRLTSTMLSLALALACAGTGVAAGTESNHIITVNARVSNRQIALNQPVRIEFTTMPRQVESVDIAKSVANGLLVNSTWRLLGRPTVVEHDKTKTVTVAVNLLPRTTGNLVLPQIQVSWLQGDQAAEFGQVAVTSGVIVGGETKDLPKETTGVAGYAWGSRLVDVKTTRIPDNLIEYLPDRAIARPQPGLELVFRGGELSDAVIAAPGLDIDQARESFFSRWGLPQIEEANAVTWILGWTRITASASGGDVPGVKLTIVREDILARLNQSQVKDSVFSVLDGPSAAPPAEESEEQARDRRKREADEFLKQQQNAKTVPDELKKK